MIPFSRGAMPVVQVLVGGIELNPGDIFGLLDPTGREVKGPSYGRQTATKRVSVRGHEGLEVTWLVESPGEIWVVGHLVRFDQLFDEEPIDGIKMRLSTTLYGSLGATITFQIANGDPSK